MDTTLGSKRERFSRCFAQLVLKAFAMGYTARIAEVARSDEQAEINALGVEQRVRIAKILQPSYPLLAGTILNNSNSRGIRNSLHQLGVAGDLLLFKDGKYLTKSEDYRALGEWWESLGEDHRWGGRFDDGDHFSIEHNGVK